jgi:UDP-N-acetylmuramate dehydrogenase
LPKPIKYNTLIKHISGVVKPGELLSSHTTLQVGGPADLLIDPLNKKELLQIIAFCQTHTIPFYLLGWGSNLLVSDKGFPGIIIHMQNSMNHFDIQGNKVIAEAGASVPFIIQETLDNNLTGMDFMYGIPGTVGGCTCMNAGTNNHSISELIEYVQVIEIATREEKTLYPDVLGFEYRKSVFQKQEYIILSVCLQLIEGKKQEELQKLRLAKEKRRNTQPLQYPNAGCIWKNPPELSAGKLIEEAGLKGYMIGGAQISNLHGNFIINQAKASASDILNLILYTEKTVQDNTGILLEREIQILGNFTA